MEYMTLNECKTLVAETFNKLGCPELIGQISVTFNNRFTGRMGDANYSKRRIRLSKPLCQGLPQLKDMRL